MVTLRRRAAGMLRRLAGRLDPAPAPAAVLIHDPASSRANVMNEIEWTLRTLP